MNKAVKEVLSPVSFSGKCFILLKLITFAFLLYFVLCKLCVLCSILYHLTVHHCRYVLEVHIFGNYKPLSMGSCWISKSFLVFLLFKFLSLSRNCLFISRSKEMIFYIVRKFMWFSVSVMPVKNKGRHVKSIEILAPMGAKTEYARSY